LLAFSYISSTTSPTPAQARQGRGTTHGDRGIALDIALTMAKVGCSPARPISG